MATPRLKGQRSTVGFTRTSSATSATLRGTTSPLSKPRLKGQVSGPVASPKRAPVMGKASPAKKAPAPAHMGNASMIRSKGKATPIRGGRSAAQGLGDAKAFARARQVATAGPRRSAAQGPKNPLPPMSQRGGRAGLAAYSRGSGPSKGGPGIDLGKFASEVSTNYARGAAAVGGAIQRGADSVGSAANRVIPSRQGSGIVPNAMKDIPNNPLKKYGR